MKNIVLSAVAVLAMSSFAVAGGDIAPVEEPVVVVEPVITDSGFYLGLGYGFMNVNVADEASSGNWTYTEDILDEDYSSIMLQAGYKFNSYVAVEGRYWFGLDSDTTLYSGSSNIPADVNVDSWGIYVKPMYPVTDAFDIYALLGYASSDLSAEQTVGAGTLTYDSDSLDGFSWGIGAQYTVSDNFGIFVDYVSIYDDADSWYDVNHDVNYDTDQSVSAITLGVNYQF